MRHWQASIALVVILALGALAPLAYISPPDPSWLQGLWDDADYDDVVILAASASGIVSDQTLDELPFRSRVLAEVFMAEDRLHPAPAPYSHQPRSPPSV